MLKKAFTHPMSYPDLHQYRLVEMYTRACTVTVTETILKTFTEANSVLQFVLATTAFGMGIDCPNIRRIIHYQPILTPMYRKLACR